MAATTVESSVGEALLTDSAREGRQTSTTGEEDECELTWKYWEKYLKDEDTPLLPKGVCVATDGGVSDVDELMYGMQYLYSGFILAFCAANVYMISKADLTVILVAEDETTLEASSKFLLTKDILKHLLGESYSYDRELHKLVPFLEFTYMVVVIVYVVYHLLLSTFARPRFLGPRWELIRWTYISEICWNYVPQLSTFSAMRLLYYVTPSVLATQAYILLYLVKIRLRNSRTRLHKLRVVGPVLHYIVTRVMALILGVDAFLVKFRMASNYINRDEYDFINILGSFIFLFQVLGVVNVNWFVRERLFIFIFGGEDGNLDDEEKAKWHVWNAVLTKRIYQHFGVFKGTIVMLGFDDYDFQMLVLDDAEKDQKMERKRLSQVKVVEEEDLRLRRPLITPAAAVTPERTQVPSGRSGETPATSEAARDIRKGFDRLQKKCVSPVQSPPNLQASPPGTAPWRGTEQTLVYNYRQSMGKVKISTWS